MAKKDYSDRSKDGCWASSEMKIIKKLKGVK